ncbi:MAG: hypothetical protein JWM82_508 [Myxococcales bacterium]|nr:hypothetical protein [Myxococcales bacterium]
MSERLHHPQSDLTKVPPFFLRILIAAILSLGAWGAVSLVDGAVDNVQRDAEALAPKPPPPLPGEALPDSGRIFVFFCDSLRAQRAELMPTLRAMRPRSLFVRVQATRDAATVPSVRAAFTGRTQRSIFAFVKNFGAHGGTTPSLFSQAESHGLHVATFSDGAFYELAPGITVKRKNDIPPGEEEERQVRAFHEALDLYRAGGEDLVVFHYTIVDHVAHTRGTKDPIYEHAFAVADQLLKEADAAVPATDTLVLMGDHGHDDLGRHFPSLKVPTVALYRGPAFKAGAELGPVPLTIHRYLMSWALGLPLSPEYRGVAAPQVLMGPTPPIEYRVPQPELSTSALVGRRLVWLGPLALLIAGVAAFGAWAFAPTSKNARRAAVATLVGATLLAALGAYLAHRRLLEAPPTSPEILLTWGLVLVVAVWLVASGFVRRIVVSWLVLALPTLLLYSSAARDGWAAVMGPAWLVTLALLLVDWARRRIKRPEPTSRREWLGLLALAGLVAILPQFFYAETDGVTSGDWRGYLFSNRMVYWIVISTGARLVLFARPRRGTFANVVAVGLVGLFLLVSFGDALHTQASKLVVAAALLVVSFVFRVGSRLGGPESNGAKVSGMLGNAGVLLAYRASVILGERTLLQMELLLAAIVLSAHADRALGRREDRRSFTTWLEAMALVIAAWSTLALTLGRLEWKVFYNFFPALFVEHHVGLLLPGIVGRYALPLVLARRLLAEASPDVGSTWRQATGVMTLKVAALALGVVGSAILDPASEPFLSAVQCLLTFSVLAFAFVYEPWRGALWGSAARRTVG